MKIIFFGGSAYVIPILEYLRTAFDVALVVTTEKDPHKDAIPQYCEHKALSYITVISLKKENVTRFIQAINAPVAVLAHFGLIVPKDVIEIFPKGIVNIHPSLLPEYRGPTPGQTAILDGKEKTGVSIMLLDMQVDHGPVLTYKEEFLSPADTSVSFYERAFKDGARMLEQVLPAYVAGEIKPQEQDHAKATFTKILTRESGFIDDNPPPDKTTLDRMIRAFHPWPGAWTKYTKENSPLTGKVIKFLPDTHFSKTGNRYLIQVEGKKPMSVKDFLNGYPQLKDWIAKLAI